MNPGSQREDATRNLDNEIAGVIVIVASGIGTIVLYILLSPLIPAVPRTWIFLLLIGTILGGAKLLDSLDEDVPSTDREPRDQGGLLGVDLLNWANHRVGKQCIRCETEITHIPLGQSDGENTHRIECGCTVIQSRSTN